MMYRKKECVAMLLAGGQGSRLYALTEKTAKPAVPFGGKYRIIDLTLSNCINSGIDTVGVLTQYQPLVLNEYIGNGQPWDLDRARGGVMVLPPYQGNESADWYKGTANAIYQNLNFIDNYDPEYVVVLSGDHIYKMDYSMMLDFHKSHEADATIAVIDVPLKEASRFGILDTDGDGRITRFTEKPQNPTSTKASMGIYIFNRAKLAEYLRRDEQDPSSANDFGKNIIPAMLGDGAGMYAYPFTGYWKDVGTIESLWEANMDLLGTPPVFNIYERSWRIYSRNYAHAPEYIGEAAQLSNCLISEGCEVYGDVSHSVVATRVYIAKDAVVRNSVIHSGCVINSGAVVNGSIIDSGTVVGAGCTVGAEPDDKRLITVVGAGHMLPERCVIPAGTIISTKYKFDIN